MILIFVHFMQFERTWELANLSSALLILAFCQSYLKYFNLSRFIVWKIYSKLVSYHPHSTALMHKWWCFYWSVNVAPHQSTFFIQVNNDVIFAWHSHSGYANDNNVFLSESKKRNVNIRNYLFSNNFLNSLFGQTTGCPFNI